MRDKVVNSQQRIASSSEAITSESPVIVRTMSGFEIWLDRIARRPERSESGTLIYRFVVTSPEKAFTIMRVEIQPATQDAARYAIGPSFTDHDSVWHTLAYDALSDALEQPCSVFEEGCLVVERLSPAQLDLARRCGEEHI